MEDKNVKIDEVSIDDTNDAEEQKNKEEPKTVEENAKSESDIEKLNQQITDLNDKYLRIAAELENTRRRAVLDAESSARNRAISVAKKFLPVMDAIDAALKHNPEDEGVKSMALAMENAFTQLGITKIETVGNILNPQYHNAIQVVQIDDSQNKKIESNMIIEEMQAGYMFGDSVLRTAMVVVAK